MSDSRRREERTAEEKVANQLQVLGYDVVLNPTSDQLPVDLGTYEPDLIGFRNNGGVIVEVRPSERRLSPEEFTEIARMVRTVPGWRFLLVPIDRLHEDGLPLFTALPSWAQIAKRATTAKELLTAGMHEQAFVSAWSGLEGALRRLGEDNDLPVIALSTLPLIKHLYTAGLLSRDELGDLERLYSVRNAVVHGFNAEGIARDGARSVGLLVGLVLNRGSSDTTTI